MVLKPRFDSQAIFRMTWWICDRTLCSAAVPWSAAVNRSVQTSTVDVGLAPDPVSVIFRGSGWQKAWAAEPWGFSNATWKLGAALTKSWESVKRGLQHNHSSVELQASLVFSMFFLSVVVLFCTKNSRWGLSSIDGWQRYLLMAHVFANDHSQDMSRSPSPDEAIACRQVIRKMGCGTSLNACSR